MGQGSLISTDSAWLVVGRIGRPFGVKGWVHIHSFTEIPDKLFSYPNWQLKRSKGIPLAVTCEQYKAHGANYIAQFVGWDDRDLAAAWTNADIMVQRELLPSLPEGEFYWQDLIGLTVYNKAGHYFGVVDGLWETKANDILVIKTETGKEVLIPFVPEAYDIQINMDEKTLIVDWPEDF
jgi:16S rRNA processing protein RimM